MRLTTELLQAAHSYLNPLNDRELDLRGHKIPAIENLGVAATRRHRLDGQRHPSPRKLPPKRTPENPLTRAQPDIHHPAHPRRQPAKPNHYRKVKDVEREAAGRLFGSVSEPSALAARIMGIKSRTFDISEPLNGGQKEYTVRLSAAERKSIEARIRAAKSLEEVARLERELREGLQSSGDAMEE
ncbi:unnamed protein product [Tuber melanosporum]|uniref:(Perigord truffle) hypothetical protein n=1 Tax=Tuber melanosporum (strain Mel28) TaxID=656061 RepID=D5GHQ7_TUBMM|nr:uncharacterized protein GSTUM_00007996001 [Tuber melanosporum]CAZ84018.1 unnamed protein product [Tuber melanosporum]